MTYFGYSVINGYRSGVPAGFYDPIRHHTGVDIGCPVGTELSLPWDTVCLEARKQTEMGNVIYLEDSLYGVTVLAHLSAFKVKKGDKVPSGTVVALSGNTGGKSTGAHVHMEMICRKPEKGGEDMYRKELSPFIGFNVDPEKYWQRMSRVSAWKRMTTALRRVYAKLNN